ncbi:MAG: hypothetical protein KAT17_09365, partial [Candidatus Aminicenantes bacterium]|nr:hypothetical protein [Candidatus Aminicenantes bacterium]
MKYKFQVDRKIFEVEISNSSTFFSETSVKINKKYFNIMIGDQDEAEVKSFFLDNKPYQIKILKHSDGYPKGIFVNGEYYPASILKIDKFYYNKEKPVEARKSGRMRSFIPGTIKKVFFKENDRVNAGDVVLIHATMKMENEIRCPKSGIIKS